ncbi:MAG TPA: hypothetical protein EYP19_01630, partial [Desulfobacterales bacterium]|nr:hypothetical protein [Desulfobacterales bacterium]
MARQYLAKSTFLSCALLLSLLAAIPLAAEGQTTPDLRKQAGASGDDPFAVPDGDSNHLVEFIR